MRPIATSPSAAITCRDLAPRPIWRRGSQVMARCKLGRPAMGSDSTISRTGRQGPPLLDTDLAQAAGSNFSPNIASETGSTGYVETLVRLQAEAACDDFFLDLGGAAETPPD